MIGLSPLPAAHPLRFQPKWVRPSTGSYPCFSLAAGRSPGFASAARDWEKVALFRLAFAAARQIAWPRRAPQLAGSFYKRHAVTPPSKGRSDCLWAHGFRRCFTPLSGCFSPFPHGTGSLSVTREYLGLGDGPPRFRRDSTCLAVLRILLGIKTILNTRLLLSLAYLPR